VQIGFEIAGARTATNPVRTLAERALHRLHCLQVAGHAIALWTVDGAGHSLPERFELFVALGEMRYRMGGIRRDCMWSETGLTEAENRVLEPLWGGDRLNISARSPRHKDIHRGKAF
jgi:hypothetical protein